MAGVAAPHGPDDDEQVRRKRNVRLAVVLGLVVLVIYFGFYAIRAWVG